MMIIPLFKGFWPSQVVQDSVHQQYETIMHTCTPESIWNLSQETPGYVRPWNLPRWGECRNGWSWNDEPPGSVEVRLTLNWTCGNFGAGPWKLYSLINWPRFWSVQIRNFSTWSHGKASGFGVGIHHWYTHPNIGQWVHETSDTSCYCRDTAKNSIDAILCPSDTCDRYVCVALYGSVLYDFQQLKSMRSLMVPLDEWSLHHKLCASKAKDQVGL